MVTVIVIIWILVLLYIVLDPKIDKYTDYTGKEHCILWYGDYNSRKKIVLY